MSKPIERLIACWHCGGAGHTPSGGVCLDCHGSAQLCPLCGQVAAVCECPDGKFAGEFETPKRMES